MRAAGPEDAASALAFWAAAAYGTSVSDDLEGVERLVRHPTSTLLLAVNGPHDEIVGSVIAGWDGWRFSLYRLAVASSSRRRGVASALLTEAAALARSVGARQRFEQDLR